MKTIIILLITSYSSILFAQNKQFKSSSTFTYKKNRITESIDRDVTITKETITITKMWNGGTEDAKFKIERTEKKDYNLDPSVWYYCVDTKEDLSFDGTDKMVHRKTIVIIPDGAYSMGLMSVFQFSDEVTVHQYVLSIN